MAATLTSDEAFVTGALQVSDEGDSYHTASQGLSESISSNSAFGRTSLEYLETVPSLPHLTLPENEDAIHTALPDSNDEELLSEPVDSNGIVTCGLRSRGASLQEPALSVIKSYASIVDTLSLHLPHLSNVKSSSRHNNVSVTCYDYLDDTSTTIKAFSVMPSSDELQTAEGSTLRQHLESVPPKDVHFRLVVASDLSTDLIECLGTSLSISPEVYEEHLFNSGWQNGKYNDQKPDSWVTRDMKKSHMSLQWFRPIKRVLQRPYSTSDRHEFLDPRKQSFSWTETLSSGLGKPRGIEHVSRPATNILRQDWDMKTDAEVPISAEGFAAWEERATVWSKQCGGYHVAVVLLDPLPIIEDEMRGATDLLRRLGVDQSEPTTSIQVMDEYPAESNITGLSVTEQAPKELVKSTTFVRHRPRMDQNFSFRSLGKLLFGTNQRPGDSSTAEPDASQDGEDPESGEQAVGRKRKIKGIRRARARNGVPELLSRFFRRSRKKAEKMDGAKAVEVLDEKEGTEIKTLKPMNRCMFEGLYPRGPATDYEFLMDPENVHILAEYLDRTKPTAANLAEWLNHHSRQQLLQVGPTTHLECLFGIIRNDTMNTLRHMELALQEIGQLILDDTLIQQRLVHWRLLLERFGIELQQLEETLRRFARFINASKSSHMSNEVNQDNSPSPVEQMLKDSVLQINSLRQHTTRSHKSLMANMSIVESKRGIAEAESVTKLTELAFFFIPLTFSASIFSMQVRELNASRTSIAAFFILAIVITTASYCLRLLIRSQDFINLRRKTLRDIRQNAGIASGSSIPTTTFLAWLWRRVGLLTVIVTFWVVLLVTPTAVLWTRDMNHGLKVLLTILLLAFILAASYVTGNAMLYIDGRGLHLRRDIFKPGVQYKERPYQRPLSSSDILSALFSGLSNRWFLIGLLVTGVGAGPAAALWTSQLITEIKVGVTIVITILYVATVVYILLYKSGLSQG